MALSYGPLVKEAAVMLDKFNAGKQCLDDFIEGASKAMDNWDALDKTFILDVVSGCVEYKKLLDIVLNVFYVQNGKCLLRGDRNQFMIICYLAVFCLDDLDIQNFSNIVKSVDVKKMHKFLGFLFNVTNLTTWIQGEWSHIYDDTYVKRNWITPMLRWRPQIEVLLDQLAHRAFQGSPVKKAPTKTTEPKEFSLTKPKPRPLPLPEPIPQQEKHKPVPDSTYKPPKEMEAIEKIKQMNHENAKQMLDDANIKQFKCANPEKSQKTKGMISQIQESFESKLKFDAVYSSGPPASDKINHMPIKLNNAAILREKALYERKVEEELRRMERLMEGGREPSSFLQWQNEMRSRDLAQLELNHLEGRISDTNAAMARTQITELNQKTAQLKKEETAELMKQYAKWRLKEEREMRDLVQKVADGHKNSKAAKRKLQEFNQRIVKEVSEKSRELLNQALEEAQAELSRKFQIIREIQAIESVQPFRYKFADTETAGHELLCEMSLAELRERLALVKEAEEREQVQRRERILEDKHNKKELLLGDLEAIELHRNALAEATARRKEEEKAKQAAQRQAVASDPRVLALQRKLKERQQEYQRQKQNEKNKAKHNEQAVKHTLKRLNRQRNTPEKKVSRGLEQSLERSLEQHIKMEASAVTSERTTLKALKLA